MAVPQDGTASNPPTFPTTSRGTIVASASSASLLCHRNLYLYELILGHLPPPPPPKKMDILAKGTTSSPIGAHLGSFRSHLRLQQAVGECVTQERVSPLQFYRLQCGSSPGDSALNRTMALPRFFLALLGRSSPRYAYKRYTLSRLVSFSDESGWSDPNERYMTCKRRA